jgi:hypothetical protein
MEQARPALSSADSAAAGVRQTACVVVGAGPGGVHDHDTTGAWHELRAPTVGVDGR